MSTISEMLAHWAKPQPARPSITTDNHETDEFGFPLCRCHRCRERSITLNAQYVARLFSKIGSPHEPRDLDRQEEIDAGNDYVTQPQQAGGATP